MKKILVTGAKGFVGKNLVLTLNTLGYTVLEFDRDNSLEELESFTKVCDFVINLAGVNRPIDPKDFYTGNTGFAETVCNLLQKNGNKAPILISSSIQAELDNDYGKSKQAGEDLVFEHGKVNESAVFVYRLANLYGKWCRPNYNSVTATWCHNVAHGIELQINDPRFELDLCYIDDVIAEFVRAIEDKASRKGQFCFIPEVDHVCLGELFGMISSFSASRGNLSVANMNCRLERNLYSTYLSYLPEDEFSYPLKMNVDDRGSFTEFIKTDGQGQVSVNISKPGITKGNHWHHSKNEKFLVVSGEGLIQFRKMGTTKVIDYLVSGEKLEVVDIPTGYTHNISNVGDRDMVTVMWVNEIFDPANPDTFFEKV